MLRFKKIIMSKMKVVFSTKSAIKIDFMSKCITKYIYIIVRVISLVLLYIGVISE